MRRCTTGVALGAWLAVAGCAGTRRTTTYEDACATLDGDGALTPRLLEGEWTIELEVSARELRYQPPSAPFPAANTARGTLRLSVVVAEAQRDSALAAQVAMRGIVRAPLDSLLSRLPPGWSADAVPVTRLGLGAPRGGVALLVGADTCADCGHLVLRAVRRGDRVCGRWHQQFLGMGDRGTFHLTR